MCIGVWVTRLFASLKCYSTLVAKNGLEIIKPLTVKLQKRDQDIVEAIASLMIRSIK